MGAYLNPGSGAFEKAVHSEIFEDKTVMLSYLNRLVNTEQRFVAVSRPRRFGKSVTAGMVCAYYGRDVDSRKLFENRKIAETADWDNYLNRFHVLHIIMTEFIGRNETVSDGLSYLEEELVEEIKERWPHLRYGSRRSINDAMRKVYAATGESFVIVIDEWDAAFRERKNDAEGQKEYLDFLRDWLKDKEYVALAYMTGILPIKKYGKHSALNMFREYSMTAQLQLAEYTGFTADEVKALCDEYHRDYEKIREWYDGYALKDVISADGTEGRKYELYCPLSVVEAISTGYIQNYWNKTENYEALAEYIRMDYDGLKAAVAILMDGGRVKVNIRTYQNDMVSFQNRDDILTMLIHLGYLGYDMDSSEVFIPNREILDEYRASTGNAEWEPTFRAYRLSEELLEAVWGGDEEGVASALERAHDHAENKTYNSEAALSYAIQYAFYAAEKYYSKFVELDTGKGYADIVYLPSPQYPKKPAMLVELKYEKDVKTAIDQIKDKDYPERLEHYKGNLILIGIDYDKELRADQPEYKRHSCRIERV